MSLASLPTELVIHIFVIVSRIDKRTALSLTLVSRWVRKIIDPVLYHDVEILSYEQFKAFELAIARKGIDFMATHVRRLWWGLRHSGSAPSEEKVLIAFTGVSDLTIHHSILGAHSLPGYRPQYVTVLGFLDHVPSDHSIFAGATHVCFPDGEASFMDTTHLATLPHLTHFACAWPQPHLERSRYIADTIAPLFQSQSLRRIVMFSEQDDIKAICSEIKSTNNIQVNVARFDFAFDNGEMFWERALAQAF